LKGTHPGAIPARFCLIWFSGFRGEDLNVIFYQNMPLCPVILTSNQDGPQAKNLKKGDAILIVLAALV
jgi:hypothetical protein